MLLNFKELGEENTNNGTLVIIHGLFGMLDNLMTIGRKFAEKYHVYLVDARNHGRSDWEDDHSYHAMSEDIYELIDNQNIKKPIFLLGHSMGGKAVMQFAADYPQLFDKLIVVDIAPKGYPVHHGTILDALNEIDLAHLTNRNEAEEVMTRYGLDVGTRQFLMKNLYRTDEGSFAWRMNLATLTAQIEKIGEKLNYHQRILAPTLFVGGGKSQYIRAEDHAEINSIFPNARIVTIEGAGHWIHAEKPNELYEVVVGFLVSA
jgi:esterase